MPQNVEIYLSKQPKFNSTYHIHYLTPNNYLRNIFLIPCAYHSTICQLHVAALLLTHFFLKISFYVTLFNLLSTPLFTFFGTALHFSLEFFLAFIMNSTLLLAACGSIATLPSSTLLCNL